MLLTNLIICLDVNKRADDFLHPRKGLSYERVVCARDDGQIRPKQEKKRRGKCIFNAEIAGCPITKSYLYYILFL